MQYEVKHEEAQRGSYEHEFNLYVDGDVVVTASELERHGISFDDVPNWTEALRTFGDAYVDGVSKDEAIEHVKDAYVAA